MQLSKPILVLVIILAVIAGGAGVLFMLNNGYLEIGGISRTIHEPLYPAVNKNGDPLLGSFSSRIPCGDCYGIKFGLVLYHDAETKAPTTYKLMRVGVGGSRGYGENDRIVNEGTWTIKRGVAGYPNGVVYELDLNAPSEYKSYWAINENLLLILDQYGNPRVGHEGFGYILNKVR